MKCATRRAGQKGRRPTSELDFMKYFGSLKTEALREDRVAIYLSSPPRMASARFVPVKYDPFKDCSEQFITVEICPSWPSQPWTRRELSWNDRPKQPPTTNKTGMIQLSQMLTFS
jgi:hypothetical protein